MQRKAKGHDMGIVFLELERRGIFGERGYVHLKKIYRKLAVDVV